MAVTAYLWLKDHGGNPIKGDVKVKGREGSIEVLAYDHGVLLPTDDNTGKITGSRIHDPFRLTKATDDSSPVLNRAVASAQSLVSAEIKLYRSNDAGQEEEYYNFFMEDVKIVSVNSQMPNVKDPEKQKYGHQEHLELRYEKITWKFVEGNIISSDAWNERTTAPAA